MTVICKHCGTHSVISVNAKCDDRCSVVYNDTEKCDYVPSELGIGGGDYIKFSYCHICMRIQRESISLPAIQEVFGGE